MKFLGPTFTSRLLAMAAVAWVSSGLPSELHAQAAHRSISFDSRYVVHESNEAMSRFGLDLFDLATRPGGWIGSAGRGRSALAGVVVLATAFYVGEAHSLANHEFGHGTRNGAAGFGTVYGFGTLRDASDVSDALASGALSENIYAYFVRSLVAGSGGFAIRRAEGGPFSPLSPERLDALRWEGARRAGGMNNEMFMTEGIEDAVAAGRGHVAYYTGYLKGKLSASDFSSSSANFGDIPRLVNFYRDRGLDIEASDLDRGSKSAFLVSALSYQFVAGVVRTLAGGEIDIRPWVFRGIEAPNTSFYMNRDGLSLKVRSAARFGDFRMPFALERLYHGDARTEVTVGGEGQFERSRWRADLIVGRALGFSAEWSYAVEGRLHIAAGVTQRSERNLHGERHIPSLEGGATYRGLHGRLTWRYE